MGRPGAAAFSHNMKLWLVRHAQPLVEAGVCYGRLNLPADIGATAECAKSLAVLLPARLRVVTSPLQRCEQLARALYAQRPDLAYKTDDRLLEMDFGQWEGRAWQAIGQSALEAWTADFANHTVGRDGETVTAFMGRIASAFDELQALGNEDAVWITHAGVIRAMTLMAQGIRHIERADQWPLDAPKYGQWRLLELHTD